MSGEKLITVILPQGQGLGLLQALRERGVVRAAVGTARAPFTYVRRRGGVPRTVHHSVEKDIVTVIVAAEQSDDIFAFLHQASAMAETPGGFMFQGPLRAASAFALPLEATPAG